MWTDEDIKTLSRIPKYCRSDDIETLTSDYLAKIIPIPIDFDDDDARKEEDETDDENHDHKYTSGKLDKWDKGARSWLSAGTMFLLIILFHVIQIRSDLRRFTVAANIQVEEACGILDDKALSLQTALSLAVKDVGPITFKFVRDLKTKLRSAFHFAAQIFGGRVRSFFFSMLSYRYCILVGVIVILKSLCQAIWAALSSFQNQDGFIVSIIGFLSPVASSVTNFLTNPAKFFSELMEKLLDVIFDADLLALEIPEVAHQSSRSICRKLNRLKFQDVNKLLQSYINKLIIALSIMLVLFNAFQFISIVEKESKEGKLVKTKKEKDENSSSDEGLCEEEPPSCTKNVSNWVYDFLSYEPFWIFLTMGIFGLLHAHFSQSLHRKAQEIKKNVIDPQIDAISEDFTVEVTDFLVKLEKSWKETFQAVVRPITRFIENMVQQFGPVIDNISNYGNYIVGLIDCILNFLSYISPIKAGISATLDCLFLEKVTSFVKISTLISEKLRSSNLYQFVGGVVHLLKNSIKSIFRRLKLTKHLKKWISISFLMFLRLVAKRSMFLYVYLIVCAILICQGVIMMIIKLILGYY